MIWESGLMNDDEIEVPRYRSSEEILENPNYSDLIGMSIDHDKMFKKRKWELKIPFIRFPAGWDVLMRPAHGGALIRFLVKLPEMGRGNGISVYLDVYGLLGGASIGEDGCAAYWEAYPINGDTKRFLLKNVKGLIKALTKELSK